VTGFGGPAAHTAMMRAEIVVRRRWLTEAHLLELIAATNLIPGPNSTELALHIGRVKAGLAGLLVAGLAFIAPAMLITAGFAWAYVEFGTVPAVGGFLVGVKPVILAIVVQAIWGLAPAAAKTTWLRFLGAASLAATMVGADELAVLAFGGLAGILVRRGGAAAMVLVAPAASPAGLFVVFAKIGSVLFGSGYVLLSFLRSDLVERLGWLTEAQVLDAVAVGQVTPGPVFTTATFIGYVLSGPWGALLATIGIFLPAFVLVALSGPLLPWLRRSPDAKAFLESVAVVSVALMVAVTVDLGRGAIVDWRTAAVGVAAMMALIRGWLGPTALIALGGGIGVVGP